MLCHDLGHTLASNLRCRRGSILEAMGICVIFRSCDDVKGTRMSVFLP